MAFFDDFNSMAPIIGGALGGLLGGGPGGAIYGAGRGAKVMEERELKQEEAAREQQKIDLARQHQARQQEHWGMLDRQIASQVQSDELGRQRLQAQIAEANQSAERREALRSTLSPEDQKIFDTMGPEKWGAQELDRRELAGASAILKQLGLSDGDARYLGPQGVGRAYGVLLEAKKSRVPQGHFDAASGLGIIFNPNTMRFTSQQVADPRTPVEDRIKIWKAMEERFRANPGNEGKDFSEYATSPEGQLEEAYHARRITPEQFQVYSRPFREAREAEQRMRLAWEGVGDNASFKDKETRWQRYLSSPAGQAMLERYKQFVRGASRSQPSAQPTEPAPTRPQAPAATQPRTSGRQPGQRRSLDEIAKEAGLGGLGG